MVRQFEAVGAEVLLLKYERDTALWHLAKGLIRLFKEKKPDIVHVQYLAPGFIPVVSARIARVPTVFATVHQPGWPYGKKAKLLLRLGAFLCTAFFCVSESAEESWFGDSELFNPRNINRQRKHFTIYNAVDAPAITQVADSTDREYLRKSIGLDGRPVIGVVGRLRSEKGHSILLNAMTGVIKALPEAMLLIVGDGPERTRLLKKAKVLGIADHVLWAGAKRPEEVFELYGVMDVVAVPSLFEGFGLSAAEAMAAGRPVVGSNIDGLREVVEDGIAGHLVPVGDSSAMAKRIVELLSNRSKAQAMGEAGCQRVTQQFSLERFAESTLAAYRYFS
jgi:glycosyltransferase involved in cell wall biosynthesis